MGFDKDKVGDMNHLARLMHSKEPADRVRLKVYRRGKGVSYVNIGLEEIEPDEVTEVDLTGGVSALTPDGLAGIEPGKRIGGNGGAKGKDVAPQAPSPPSASAPTVSRLDFYRTAPPRGQLVDVYR